MSTVDTSEHRPTATSTGRRPASSTAKPGTSRTTQGRFAAVAIGVTVLLWASAFVAIRHLEADVSPGPLTLGRCLVASLVLGLLLLRQRGLRRPSREQWTRLVVCGVLWMGFYNVALNSAEQHLDAAARLASTTYLVPPLVIVLGWVALGEAPPLLAVVGGGACLAGVAVARGRQRTAR